jgi:hypothetical protein
MDKKLIKAILDVIKDVSDRPGLYGAEINGRYIYFTDGYVIVCLEMGVYENLRPFPNANNVWVSGEQLKEIYKGLGAREVCLTVKNEHGEHPDWVELWGRWSDAEPIAEAVPIRPDTFKKLAPFGDMLMTLTENKFEQKLVAFNGTGVSAFACPLKNL